MNNKILIICGDPNSINSEIIFKTWIKLNRNQKRNICLIGNYELLLDQFLKLKFKVKIIKVNNLDAKITSQFIKILDIPLKFKNPFKVSLQSAKEYISQSLNLAHQLALNKKVKGIINCPVNKDLINSSRKIGVTELLASKCKITDNSEVMMIHNAKLSVVPITTHIKIKNISKNISANLIIKKIITLNKDFKKLFRKKPKIGILGLNPHNSELVKDAEENVKILPAILSLRKKGIDIQGPIVPDTAFVNIDKKMDVIVGMYHDQVLSPYKALFKYDAINLTLGLKYVRVSPDHGPAVDIICKNKANYTSLLKCVNFISNLK
jgi:4-hydroxy-L-threonine phosphate dehydrogenase PdxA